MEENIGNFDQFKIIEFYLTHSHMPNRRLAAIMFSDIEGYTAMMEKNEGEALSQLKRYKRLLEKEIPRIVIIYDQYKPGKTTFKKSRRLTTCILGPLGYDSCSGMMI